MVPMKSNLETRFCNLSLSSPIVLLSGCVGFGEEYTRLQGFSNKDAGAICLKGTTLNPRQGNKPHRVVETPSGMLNSIGLQNPGAEKVITQILPSLNKAETKYFINISGSSVEEYGEIAKRFDDTDIDAIEINISCPNVKEGGATFGNNPDMSFRVVDICRKNTSKPLITKLSPNQTDIAYSAKRCIEAGSDGLAVINTLMGMAIDSKTRKPIIGHNSGGLSGPSIKPVALLNVYKVYQESKKHNIPIIGQGGIVSANDAIEFIIAGAATVGVGTALFYDPLVCKKINAGISQYLSEAGMKSVESLVGTLELN